MSAVASAWIGRPLLSICITTMPALGLPLIRSTPVTSPTCTPAIRTGDGMCRSVFDVKTAFSWNPEPVNGSPPPNTR